MQIKSLSCIIFLNSLLLATNARAALYGPVSTAVERLKLADGEISIKPYVSPASRKCIEEAKLGRDVLCFPNSRMTLVRKNKSYDLTKIIAKWNEFYVFFVKIRKDKYLADLNNDKRDEIAILPMLSGGGAHVLTAYIYTIMDDGLKLFGDGRFFWEFGDHVKFGCPQCWKYDLHKCDTCY